MQKKASEIFEGPNSSLKRTFDETASLDFDLPEVEAKKPAKPRIHISDNQRYKMLGNAFNVEVVAHILSIIKV